jgi:LytS/YehU family sensor histidine kinase
LLKRRELETVLLRGELSEVRLKVLRNQLQPHFLFNTLNSISALMHLDVAEAEHKLRLLADLLRSALVERNGNEVRLRDEVDFVARYLEIEKTRFPQRLSVVWETAPDTFDALVPHLVLQPLAENAVRHGIAPRSRRGTVRIRSWREDDTLHLEVCDDGVGPTTRSSPREGVGLSNTRARLFHLYGEGGQLHLGEAEGGGFLASVTLPFHTVEKSGGAQAGPEGAGQA